MASQVFRSGESFFSELLPVLRPFAILQRIVAALDLQAESAHFRQPDGEVQLGRTVVPLPFVMGEAGEGAALDLVEYAGFSPALGVVPPLGR